MYILLPYNIIIINIKKIIFSENLLTNTNDHETPERTKPSTSIPRYQSKTGKEIFVYTNNVNMLE